MNAQALVMTVHGALGVLAAAALTHPALLLRKGGPPSRRSRWLFGLLGLLTLAAYSLGLAIYGDYRAQVKRRLFEASVRAGLLFETKEHLAFVVLALTLGAAFAALVAPPPAREIRRTAALLLGLAACVCLIAVGLGIYVSSVRSFVWH